MGINGAELRRADCARCDVSVDLNNSGTFEKYGESVGGLIGEFLTAGIGSSAVVSDSAFTGSVMGESMVGGIAGKFSGSSPAAKIVRSRVGRVSATSIEGTANVGGLIGYSGYGSFCRN